jgi:hypothetical protein
MIQRRACMERQSTCCRLVMVVVVSLLAMRAVVMAA